MDTKTLEERAENKAIEIMAGLPNLYRKDPDTGDFVPADGEVGYSIKKELEELVKDVEKKAKKDTIREIVDWVEKPNFGWPSARGYIMKYLNDLLNTK